MRKVRDRETRSPAPETGALPRIGAEIRCPVELPPGILLWRRPTLARPVAVLPSGLQRFTSVFGMGTGGTTALLSPERSSASATRLW